MHEDNAFEHGLSAVARSAKADVQIMRQNRWHFACLARSAPDLIRRI